MDGNIRPAPSAAAASGDLGAIGQSDEDGPSRPGNDTLKRVLSKAKALLKPRRDREDSLAWSEILADTPSALGGPSGERELLLNVVAMRTLRVEDVMVPRADIEAVELGASLDETLRSFREGQHSRLPVYRDTLDDPVGVVHLKDLALVYGFGAQMTDFALANHLRSVLVVPPSMRVQALLQRMQATRRHMALVIDEYGGVDGLVTIEDILEQIVGEIDDEHDDADRPMWVRQASGEYVADARALVSDFQDVLGVQLLLEGWDEDIDTLGGLIFMICGRVPARGEVIAHPAGVEFEIVDADPRRIKRVRARRAAAAKGATAPDPKTVDVANSDVEVGGGDTSAQPPAKEPKDLPTAAPAEAAEPRTAASTRVDAGVDARGAP